MKPSRDDRGSVLVVDDDVDFLGLINDTLSEDGHVVHTTSQAETVMDTVGSLSPDVIILDVYMPHELGYDLCRKLKQNPKTRLIPIVLVTATDDERVLGFDAEANDFLQKPTHPRELKARIRNLVRLKRYTDALDSAEAMISGIAMIVEERDDYTQGHCSRLSQYAVALGRSIGISDADLATLYRGGFLHDLGKVGIRDAILLKPGQLSDDEYKEMKRHTLIGDELCAQLKSLHSVRPIVRHHHERFNGSGYPDGLVGDDIPVLAQIMGIVDVFDALTTTRPYKPAFSIEEACSELLYEVDKGWRRPDLVRAFIEIARADGAIP